MFVAHGSDDPRTTFAMVEPHPPALLDIACM